MTFDELIDLDLYQHALENGWIRRAVHPTEPLEIVNYTQRCQFDRAWNAVTRQCRGLIVHTETGEIVARPWPKFHNYGEYEEGVLDLDARAWVTEKLDGSLGILYPTATGYAIATRGSFASEQATHATEVWRERYEGRWLPVNGCTHLFEVVYPSNRIVCDYGDMDDLVYLETIEIETGWPISHETGYEWPGPIAERHPYRTLAEAIAAEPRPNCEGLVVFFPETNERVKIKQDDYVALHRIVFGMNERTVWEFLGEGKTAAEVCAPLPEEFWPWIEVTAAGLIAERDRIYDDARATYRAILAEVDVGDRKAFALRAVEHDSRALLFLLYDGKTPDEVRAAIWRTLRPSSPKTLVSVSEDVA